MRREKYHQNKRVSRVLEVDEIDKNGQMRMRE